MPTMLTVLLLVACRAPVEPVPSPALFEPAGEAVGLDVVGSLTGGTVWVRRVDEAGGTVPGEDAVVAVDGVTRAIPVAGDGYGRFTLELPGAAIIEADGDVAWAERAPTDWPGLPLREGLPGSEAPVIPGGELIGAAGGLLGLADGVVWWLDRPGHFHTVLAPTDPVLGLTSGDLDDDGVTDALAWTADAVHLLRGRSGGGLTHLGRIVAEGREVIGAALGDPSDDGNPDVVIVWTGGTRAGQLDVWEGDGQLGFMPASNRYLTDGPTGVTVGAAVEGGPEEITVLTEYGTWNRFYAYRGQYARSGPAALVSLPTGSVHDIGDMLGDGGHELLMADPWVAGEERRLRMMDLEGELRIITLDRPAARFFVGDLDADGQDDLVAGAADGEIVWTHNVGEPERLSTNTLLRNGWLGPGPLGLTADGDLLLAGTDVWAWFDVGSGPDGVGLVDGALERHGAVVRDGHAGLLADGSVVGVPPALDQLRVWRQSEGTAVTVGTLDLTDADGLQDLAVCGDHAYVLLAGQLVVVDLTEPTQPVASASVDVQGLTLACGEGPTGATVAVRAGEMLHLFDDGGQAAGESLTPGLEGFALGGGSLGTCSTPGCAVALGPFGADGAFVPVVSDAGGVTVDGVPVAGEGLPSVADVDGDGRQDLVLQRSGRIVVHRSTRTGFAPPRLWWTRQALVGPAWFVDRDGDGASELWALEGETHRMLVSPGTAPVPEDPPEDTSAPVPTGDTAG